MSTLHSAAARLNQDIYADGNLVAGDANGAVIGFIASVFDHDGRPGLSRFLPLERDRLWSWRDRRGELQGAMITRTWRLIDGLAGINLGYVCVRPELRRLGVGSSLVRSVVTQEEDEGAAFAMCWARDHLVDFYRSMGFADLGTEAYCELTPLNDVREGMAVDVQDLGALSHAGIDAVRRERAGAVLRGFDHGVWKGINPGFPWAPDLKVVYAGKVTQPAWYAVVGEAGGTVTMVEFSGRPEQFDGAVGTIRHRFGSARVRVNLTDPRMAQMATASRGPEIGVPFHRLLRSSLIDRAAAPITTWLDRI